MIIISYHLHQMQLTQTFRRNACLILLCLVLFVRVGITLLQAQSANAFITPQTSPLDLLPTNQATHTVQHSGNWTNPGTWEGGSIPTNSARILIPAGKVLTVDGEISTRIKIIRIDGKLQFSTTTHTELKVETIIQGMNGELEIGTLSNPIPKGITCKINIIDEGDLELMSDQWEKGLVLMGKTVIYGAKKDSWATVALTPQVGATTLRLQSTPLGWEKGDRIVIAGTDPVDAKSDEVATIQAISNNVITLTGALQKDHFTPTADLYVHVANLSRNIIIESEHSDNTLDRGHIMFMHTLDVDMNYVRIHKMGRTRKDIPIDDWIIGEGDVFEANGLARRNVRGRYSVHFHRGGVSPNLSPAYVRGCVVEDDPGWAYANHSGFVHFDNNVSYNVIGGGFQTEAGDELGSFTNNIAIRTVNDEYPIRFEAPDNAPDTRENAQDFAFQGDGYWIHGGGVSLSGNIASGCSGHAFIYWPEGLIEPGFPSGTYRNTFKPANLGLSPDISLYDGVLATGWVNIAGFKNNTAYSAGIGLATYYLHTSFFNDKSDYDPTYIATIHSTFENFTAWNIDREGIQLNFTERITFKNVKLVNNDGDPSSKGIWASHYRSKEKQIFENITIQGFGTGLMLPPQGQVTVVNGNLKNGVNMYIPSPTLSYRDMLIEGLTTAPDPAFNNPIEIRMEAFFSPPEDKFTAYFLLPDKIVLNYGSFENQRLYFNEQAANYQPLPNDAAPYTFFEERRYILAEFAQKTNQQLQNDYQLSFGGSILPEDAVDVDGIVGGKIRTWQNEILNVPVCVDVRKEVRTEEINQCIRDAGNNKVAGPLPIYEHPVPDGVPEPGQPSVKLTVLLEGMWDSDNGHMQSTLVQQQLLPLSQPFTQPPFNYNGTEQLAPYPPDIVDWVLIELRDANDSSKVITSQAAVLDVNGVVRNVNLEDKVLFEELAEGTYYVAIFHKGHLGIMSSQPIHIRETDPILYDFSSSVNQAAGTLQLKEISGRFVMFSGDYDQNGIVNNLDVNLWSQHAAALNQYLDVDADGNGIVNNKDYNFWAKNRSKIGLIWR